MRARMVSLALIACLAVGALGVAGCGSSKKHHTARNAAIAAGVALAIHHHHKKVEEKKAAAAAAASLHAGEFCSKKKQSIYKLDGFKCQKVHGAYRLAKA